MKRDKARIKPFCDQLAQLWETTVLTCALGRSYPACPCPSTGQGMTRFLWKRMKCWRLSSARSAKREKPRAPLDAEQLDSLKDRWEDMMFNLYGTKFQTEEFKSLFLDTWSYLRDAVDCYGVPHKAVPLVAFLGKFNGNNQYPAHTPPWRLTSAGNSWMPCCMGWKILCVPTPAWIFTGAAWYWSPICTSSSALRPKTFEKVFTELAEEYRKNDYEGGYDYYEQENSPSLMRKRSESARWECPLPGPFEPCGLFLQRRGFPRR